MHSCKHTWHEYLCFVHDIVHILLHIQNRVHYLSKSLCSYIRAPSIDVAHTHTHNTNNLHSIIRIVTNFVRNFTSLYYFGTFVKRHFIEISIAIEIRTCVKASKLELFVCKSSCPPKRIEWNIQTHTHKRAHSAYIIVAQSETNWKKKRNKNWHIAICSRCFLVNKMSRPWLSLFSVGSCVIYFVALSVRLRFAFIWKSNQIAVTSNNKIQSWTIKLDELRRVCLCLFVYKHKVCACCEQHKFYVFCVFWSDKMEIAWIMWYAST